MSKNNELENVLEEIRENLKDRDCNGYFICVTYDDSAGLGRYNASNYLELLGYIQLIKLDLEYAMLDALDETKLLNDESNDTTTLDDTGTNTKLLH